MITLSTKSVLKVRGTEYKIGHTVLSTKSVNMTEAEYKYRHVSASRRQFSVQRDLSRGVSLRQPLLPGSRRPSFQLKKVGRTQHRRWLRACAAAGGQQRGSDARCRSVAAGSETVEGRLVRHLHLAGPEPADRCPLAAVAAPILRRAHLTVVRTPGRLARGEEDGRPPRAALRALPCDLCVAPSRPRDDPRSCADC